MTGLDGKVSTLTAPDGVHNNKAEEMTFNNGAVVTHDGGHERHISDGNRLHEAADGDL